MLLRSLFLVVLIGFCGYTLQAQDPQFSQFYANQVQLNPAFTGTPDGPRLAINARSQWSAIPGAYKTFAAAFDMPLEFGPTRHGVGISVMADQAGAGNLTKTDVLLNYAYRFLINDKHAIRFGIAFGIQQASLDYNKLRFPNQFDQTGYDPNKSNGENLNDSRITEDINLGAVYYNKYMWAGATVNHITEPKQQFSSGNPGDKAKLPMRLAFFTGFNIPLEKGGIPLYRSISPSIMFRMQGPFTQLDLGSYVNFNPIVLGVYYRVMNEGPGESLIGLIGVQKGMFRLGYSYDYRLPSSGLTNSLSGGSHELSFVVEWDKLKKNPRNPKVNMSCPKF